MLKLDATYLADLELDGLPVEEENLLLLHIYETLEERVGERLGGAMSMRQLEEFEVFFEAKDDEGALAWLEREFPTYTDIVHDEFRLLQAEIREMAPTIRALSGKRS